MKTNIVAGFSMLICSVALTATSANAQVVCADGDLAACRRLGDRVHARIIELEALLPTRSAHGANGQEVTFTRDTSVAALGDAWRDPSGMIWGDIVTNNDAAHSIHYMDQYHASSYCESIGAQLPSREDFARLRGYMGATTAASEYAGTGYTPQVLPNLYRTEGGRTVSNYFWSSSVHPDYSYYAYFFNGRSGAIDYDFRDDANHYAVRCVSRR